MRRGEFKMKISVAHLALLSCLMASPLLADPQIGGGTCSSATLSGTYSAVVNGRAVNSSLAFTKVWEGLGTISFDGQSLVTASLTTNTNQSTGVAQNLAGTYTMQANCTGTIAFVSGDIATFSLESYNTGKNFLMTGQDGNYTITVSGGIMPTVTCTPALLTGSYAFNGSGFGLSSGSINAANNISGLLQFDGKSVITATWYIASSGAPVATIATGSYSLTSGCLATATLADSSGNSWTLHFVITAASGSSFSLTGASAVAMFSGSGRTESTTPACSVSTLSGVHSLVLTGRTLSSSGVLTGALQSVGTATFDGAGNVTFALTANTSQARGTAESYAGTYTLASNCVGSLNITTGDSATFTLIAYNAGNDFTLTGSDASYPLSGSGAQTPITCAANSYSGAYAFSGNGSNSTGLGASSVTGANSISGLLQFDGVGNVTGTWSVATTSASSSDSVTGQYTVTTGCAATATVADALGNSWTVNLIPTATTGASFSADIANLTSEFTATGHSTFTYPGLAVVNAASSVAGSTPPGSIFALYGSGLATGSTQASKVPLPDTLLTTSVTVNGEAAPLFYASAGQINSQMPLDIKPGLASVVVRNGSTTSNTVAVVVPGTATPGVFIQYPTNQGAIENQDNSVNSPASPAHVGDTVVAYFTGGGPVTPAGPLVTGSASPNGLSPVTESTQVTVAGVAATAINYTGLTPTLVGAYQVNFVIPQVAVGDHTVTLTINGVASNNTVISIAK